MREHELFKQMTPLHVGGMERPLDLLRVSVEYDKGDSRNKRGIYVRLTPASINDGLVRICLTSELRVSGFRQLVRPLTRRSQREVDYVINSVERLAGTLADTWGTGDLVKVASLVKTI